MKPKLTARIREAVKRAYHKIASDLVLRIVACAFISAAAGLFLSVMITGIILGHSFYLFDLADLLLLTVITLLIFTKLVRRTLSYIKEISAAVEQISAGDYSVKIPEKYTDELGALAARINGMAADISAAKEREHLEEQRKNDFITSIAHDLRTPLTSVIGYLGLISEQDGAPVEKETLVRYADVAYRKAQRLENLIGELFDFSRYNFGEIRPAQNRIDLAELVEQLNQEFYPQYSEKGLQSRIIISGRPIFIKGDGSMIARVFDNLLNNAVRYGANGKYIDIELVNRGNEAVVRVTNYASAIGQSDLGRVFDKFYRTDASRSSATGGTGLGLAIAKNIVEAHGGTIRAESRDGKTAFEVILPALSDR